jgi:NADPH:quinone reductase-like Zn-dependent oxidoreductase
VREGPPHFEPLAERCARGEIGVNVHSTFPLDDVAGALATVGEGRALGKVVVIP